MPYRIQKPSRRELSEEKYSKEYAEFWSNLTQDQKDAWEKDSEEYAEFWSNLTQDQKDAWRKFRNISSNKDTDNPKLSDEEAAKYIKTITTITDPLPQSAIYYLFDGIEQQFFKQLQPHYELVEDPKSLLNKGKISKADVEKARAASTYRITNGTEMDSLVQISKFVSDKDTNISIDQNHEAELTMLKYIAETGGFSLEKQGEYAELEKKIMQSIIEGNITLSSAQTDDRLFTNYTNSINEIFSGATLAPSASPTFATQEPSAATTLATQEPSAAPTVATQEPSAAPTFVPTFLPTLAITALAASAKGEENNHTGVTIAAISSSFALVACMIGIYYIKRNRGSDSTREEKSSAIGADNTFTGKLEQERAAQPEAQLAP